MDCTLINAYEELLAKAKILTQVEDKKWSNYVRTEFAELRKAIKAVEKRKKDIDEEVQEMLHAKK